MAELWRIYQGLLLACEVGIRDILIEADSANRLPKDVKLLMLIIFDSFYKGTDGSQLANSFELYL